MKKIIIVILSFYIILSPAYAQKGIDYNRTYAAGGKLLMSVDSSAKNVFYANTFPNQPRTSFSYLPEVNNLNLQINFRKNIKISDYRYTILADDRPIVVNKSINEALLKEVNRGDEEIFRSTSLGTFVLKGKIITTLVYSIEKPLDIEKAIFYGKNIPKAKIKAFSKRFKVERGVDYKYIVDLNDKSVFIFNDKDDELTIVKERSDIDYLYSISLKNKQTGKIVFESTSWQYGGIVEEHDFMPFVRIDKNVFKESGNYEISIQPMIKWTGCLDCNISNKVIAKSIGRYTLAITLEDQSYTKRELFTYTLIVALFIGLASVVIFYFSKKRNKNRLAVTEQQKNIAKLQLTSIRSQLNPHFLFNALSGIQNLMNKEEVDNANKYLSKFARLTRNVLDAKELISLTQEKALLHDYLQMEQLRFGFEYEIDSSNDLDLENIEIPSMLLQPFVENAVKHGISQLAGNGRIKVTFRKQAQDLILVVTDNGKGFNAEKKTNGLGLQLSQNRIELLNNIYKENRFTLAIQSNVDGTTVSLVFTDWL
jgi:two-component system LytT family sensor kinase